MSLNSRDIFIYDSKVIDNDAVVKIKGGERSIRQAVYDIVGDTGLEFQVIGTHILITLPSEKKIHIQQDSIPKQPVNFVIIGTLLDKGDRNTYLFCYCRSARNIYWQYNESE